MQFIYTDAGVPRAVSQASVAPSLLFLDRFFSCGGCTNFIVAGEKKKKSKHEIKEAWFENKVLKTSTVA